MTETLIPAFKKVKDNVWQRYKSSCRMNASKFR